MTRSAKKHPIKLRDEVRADDADAVRDIVASTGMFRPDEVEVAVELVDERLRRGKASGYHFLFAEDERSRPLGYTCFGPIACTVSSFDLFWIAVHEQSRGLGIGTLLLEASQEAIRQLGGTRIYVETSSRPQYEPTRAFYLARSYGQIARLEDFYAPGDGKVIYLKVLG